VSVVRGRAVSVVSLISRASRQWALACRPTRGGYIHTPAHIHVPAHCTYRPSYTYRPICRLTALYIPSEITDYHSYTASHPRRACALRWVMDADFCPSTGPARDHCPVTRTRSDHGATPMVKKLSQRVSPLSIYSLFTQPPHEGQPSRSANAASASAPPFQSGGGDWSSFYMGCREPRPGIVA
jgi:hypothetical protein